MFVTSVDLERSFSKTGQILTPQRHNLSDENLKGLAALYFDGDIESAWAESSEWVNIMTVMIKAIINCLRNIVHWSKSDFEIYDYKLQC